MSNIFSLDSLREEVEKEFAPLKIELSDGTHAVLKGLLRLDQKKRDLVLDLLGELNSDDSDEDGIEKVKVMASAAVQILEAVSDQGKKLVKELNGDLQLMVKVISTWMAATQLGEAENSPESSTDTASSSSPTSSTTSE